MSAGCQVLALLAHALVDALAVAVTLTGCHTVNKKKQVSPGSQTGSREVTSRDLCQLKNMNGNQTAGVSFPTWTVDEGPVVFGLAGTHARIEGRLRAGGQAGQGGRGRDGGLEGPAIRALDALAFARVAGVGAPAAARLLQALTARPVPGAVLSCSGTEHSPGCYFTPPASSSNTH